MKKKTAAAKKCQIAWPSQVVVNFCLSKKNKREAKATKITKNTAHWNAVQTSETFIKTNTLCIGNSKGFVMNFGMNNLKHSSDQWGFTSYEFLKSISSSLRQNISVLKTFFVWFLENLREYGLSNYRYNFKGIDNSTLHTRIGIDIYFFCDFCWLCSKRGEAL